MTIIAQRVETLLADIRECIEQQGAEAEQARDIAELLCRALNYVQQHANLTGDAFGAANYALTRAAALDWLKEATE